MRWGPFWVHIFCSTQTLTDKHFFIFHSHLTSFSSLNNVIKFYLTRPVWCTQNGYHCFFPMNKYILPTPSWNKEQVFRLRRVLAYIHQLLLGIHSICWKKIVSSLLKVMKVYDIINWWNRMSPRDLECTDFRSAYDFQQLIITVRMCASIFDWFVLRQHVANIIL